ncbi:MAG: VTT domain-containing protein [Planctomycetia bacterium]
MRRATRLLVILTLAAIAVPVIPFLLFGTRLDQLVADWLEPRPSPAVLAFLEVGVLAADLVLPVPSSMVATLGGAELGIGLGTACAFLGMTAGSLAGWWLGKTAGARALARLEPADRLDLERRQQRLGPLLVVLTRPLPIVAEAAALVAGGSGMRLADFLPAAASGNLVIALLWSAAGGLGRAADSLPLALVWSLVIPVALAWLAVRRRTLTAD